MAMRRVRGGIFVVRVVLDRTLGDSLLTDSYFLVDLIGCLGFKTDIGCLKAKDGVLDGHELSNVDLVNARLEIHSGVARDG
jgi:hypothetical protein